MFAAKLIYCNLSMPLFFKLDIWWHHAFGGNYFHTTWNSLHNGLWVIVLLIIGSDYRYAWPDAIQIKGSVSAFAVMKCFALILNELLFALQPLLLFTFYVCLFHRIICTCLNSSLIACPPSSVLLRCQICMHYETIVSCTFLYVYYSVSSWCCVNSYFALSMFACFC